jgi:hypothetical protein
VPGSAPEKRGDLGACPQRLGAFDRQPRFAHDLSLAVVSRRKRTISQTG